MGYEGKCSYTYKCERCGHEGFDYAKQDGGGSIAATHARWERKRCSCGGRYRLYASCVQYYDGSGTGHRDIPKYFNSGSAAYFDALSESCQHDDPEVRERARRELEKRFPDGVRPPERAQQSDD